MSALELNQHYRECEAAMNTLYAQKPQTLVFGDGNTDKPTLMLIGEAPGEQEALQRRPFVGKAGKNLTEFLQAIGLQRSELFISNVVKFRPTRRSPTGRTVNRPPTREEIGLLIPWLYREIAIVQPGALVTLGNVALNALLGEPSTIGACHGRWRKVTLQTTDNQAITLPLFALYHPASVIYNRSLADVYHADLLTLRGTLSQFVAHSDT